MPQVLQSIHSTPCGIALVRPVQGRERRYGALFLAIWRRLQTVGKAQQVNQLAIDFTGRHASDERQMVVEVVSCKPEMFRPEFRAWLQENFHIWKAFEHQALAAWNRGRRHYSARTICEYLRHETTLREAGDSFKLNNDEIPCLSRLFVLLNPDKALFEFRGEREAA